jgi:hypothetical protein
MLSFHDQEVSSWHNSEISARTPDVRFRGQSGKHLLAASISECDPTATFAVRCGNGFEAGFSPYRSTRLNR